MEEVKNYCGVFEMKDCNVLGGGCNCSFEEEVGVHEVWKRRGNSVWREQCSQEQECVKA